MSQIRAARRDVVRHRTALIDAAARVFTEQGVHVPLDTVAAAADVGRATLYRHFPDRAALLLALFDREVEDLFQADDAAPSSDTLIAMIARLARASRQAPARAQAWRAFAPDHPEFLERQKDMLARFEAPLAAAIAAGVLRPDLTPYDIFRVIRMVATPSQLPGQEDHDDDQAAERLLDLVLNGLRSRD